MCKLNATIIIIDDDTTLKETNVGLFLELEMNFTSVLFFEHQDEGLTYIEDNFSNERIIVMLDLDFSTDSPDGHQILNNIRRLSFLIPVIIWSGVDEDKQPFADLINNKAYAFLNKNASTEEIINTLKDAYNYSENDISIALEDWIETHSEEEKEKPFLLTVNGEKLSLNELLQHVRSQSDLGKSFSKKLSKLTIDLLMRRKENIND